MVGSMRLDVDLAAAKTPEHRMYSGEIDPRVARFGQVFVLFAETTREAHQAKKRSTTQQRVKTTNTT